MNIKTIEQTEADDLSSREESHFFDRKSFLIKGAKVQKIAVAFANADGGEVIIGIADEKEESDPAKRWKGAPRIEDLNSHLQAVFEVTPSLDLKYEILKCESKPGYTLRILVEKSSEVHKTTDGTVYQRHGAQSLPIKDPQRITQLSFAKGATSFEDQTLKEIPAEQIAESKELTEFLSEYSPKTDPLEFCINQNLLDYKTWETKVSAALLFHPYPSAVIPRKCAVKITRYETKDDDPERDHLTEQITIEKALYPLIKETVQAVEKIMSSVKVWNSDGLKKLNYPPEAIWEVIVNALIHRDYSISDDTQIIIYNNRIEILSPGRLPGYVTVENILDARYARNSKIVRTLNRYKEAPNKDLGEGLNTTFQKMKEWGLKSPEIIEEGNYVKVTLPHIPLATPTEAILNFLKTNNTITNQQTRDITGIKSENLVKIEFYKLRDEGLLERVPGLKGPKSAWQLTSKGKLIDK
ncbi:ATP-dependent DNA helicase RecG [Candidatus Electrothrix aarhusensis]|uniref:ATP-dependent DNA helicase RecG n=1 Tax=Candidatus Electrothrix aarhusensis TaxID=1859131 RepID=A0A444J356_9BACT|nr:ATP-dependent DNA helicase RecG [Candidatus Electrothrix aarhusensis]